MNDPQPTTSPGQPHNTFQKAAGEVLAQRIEALALELRGISKPQELALASTETLSVLAMTLRTILRRIDDIFEFDGFVFTPACMILLELFQARARGSILSISALCQPLSCPESVGRRWVDVLESKQLLEKLASKVDGPRVALSEKGFLKTAQALELLL